MDAAATQKIQNSIQALSDTKRTERRLVEYFVVVSSLPRQDNDTDILKSHHHHHHISSPRNQQVVDTEWGEDYVTDFQPVITARYPLGDHEGNPLSESVTFFCHPTGSIQLRSEGSLPKVHYFVTTGGRGQQMYGICLTLFEPHTLQPLPHKTPSNNTPSVYLPKCLCLLSAHPYLCAFREFLSQLYTISQAGIPVPIERYIVNFCAEIPAPPPGSFEVQTQIAESVIRVWSPPYNQPIPWVSLPFAHLFQCLDIEHVLLVWHALTLERQVLLTSTQLSLLTECAEILISLLFPLRWSHAYIPVLPHFLIPILSAPMPYLCGIDKFNLPAALFDLSRECIVVDLDKNEVTLGPSTPSLPPLPKALRQNLVSQLEKNAGMVYREVRCLSKNDDYSDRGIHLKPHVKETSDAAWEGRLCLMDEAFQLYFTPDEARKNKLNGNDGSGGEGQGVKFLTQKQRLANMRSQSQWDAVQESFLGTYVSMLAQYRKFLVFPSKSNQGSYGGAGFRSKPFVQSQRRDLQPFLHQFVSTQMFDDFITKRLYGSGEADVTFFDQAVDRLIKAGPEGDVYRSSSSLGKFFRKGTNNPEAKIPLLQSARVHRLLKTIVPPEPCASGLPLPGVTEGGNVSLDDVIVTRQPDADDTASVGSHSTGYSLGSGQRRPESGRKLVSISNGTESKEDEHGMSTFVYKYTTFPSRLKEELFGTPRPLPSAVLAEFDRQREDAARFRRRSQEETGTTGIEGQTTLLENSQSTNAEVATFTLFFISFTAAVGKDLVKISNNAQNPKNDKTILSDIVTSPSEGGKGDVVTDDETEVVSANNLVSQSSFDTGTSDATENETAAVLEMNGEGKEGDGSTTPQDQEGTPNRENDNSDQPPTSTDATDEQQPSSPPKEDSINDILGSFTRTPNPKRKPHQRSHSELPPLSPTDPPTPLSPSQPPKNPTATPTDPTKHARNLTLHDLPRNRFHDTLSNFKLLEAKVTARAQLGLAFDMLDMARQRGLKADPAAYQCLIDACGRCGDTERATTLLGRMHEDGIVADGVVYSCLVSAFSKEDAWRSLQGGGGVEERLPEWANGVAVEMDWNKLQKRSYLDIAKDYYRSHSSRFLEDDPNNSDTDPSAAKKPLANLRQRLTQQPSSPTPNTQANPRQDGQKREMVMTKPVLMQVLLGENLLELIYPDISIDTDNELCPRCHMHLMDDDVVLGWTPCDSQDYTTTCPNCTLKFVPHFCVQSTSPSFIGSRGPSSPLFCERLSPWVLQKELRSVMSEGIENLLNPEWRGSETKNATLWWNLVLSFMRYRLPFSFLLQGSFKTDLIVPTPDDEAGLH